MNGNYYEKDNIKYHRVTKVLSILDKSDALMNWAVGLACNHISENRNDLDNALEKARYLYKEKKEEAANIGSQVHGLIEQYIKSKIAGENFEFRGKYPEQVENGLLAFLDYEKKNIKEWICTERSVYHPSSYAGTLDALAIDFDDIPLLHDFKTGGIYDSAILQIGGYFNCCGYDKDFCMLAFNHSLIKKYEGVIVGCNKHTGIPEIKRLSNDKLTKAGEDFDRLFDFWINWKKRKFV